MAAGLAVGAETNSVVATNIFDRPLSLVDASDIALRQNLAIRKSKADLEASYGVAIQLRAVVNPKLSAAGTYGAQDLGLTEPLPGVLGAFVNTRALVPNEKWTSELRLVQSVYEGGRLTASLRAARLTKEQAMLQYQAVVAQALLDVRVAYDDVLLAAQQITVQESSIKLLTGELTDATNRFAAGSVPRFNVLRAEVELGNARPNLIRARNAYRIAKNNLVDSLGLSLPRTVWEDIPLQLSDKLEALPYEVELPAALGHAIEKRPELAALRKAESLQRESLVNARAGYKPSAELFAGYLWHSPYNHRDLGQDVSGWEAGAQVTWNIFDGQLTRGKIKEAEAKYDRSKLDTTDVARRIELEVRTTYSQFIQAKEVLESQKKVQEQAEEALRLAEARLNAGSGIQLDVLNAQTALTAARTTQIQALHDHSVTRVRLQRAIGDFPETIIVK